MAEYQDNLWAPWRMDYIRSADSQTEDAGCFLCRYAANAAADAEQLVLWRGETCMALLNRFPYTNGHILVAPFSHTANLCDLEDDALHESIRFVRDAQALVRDTMNPDGCNVGMNLGRAAGAGVPDHLHWHLVPRWSGDTNFMPVIGNLRVIPESLEANYAMLRDAAKQRGLGS